MAYLQIYSSMNETIGQFVTYPWVTIFNSWPRGIPNPSSTVAFGQCCQETGLRQAPIQVTKNLLLLLCLNWKAQKNQSHWMNSQQEEHSWTSPTQSPRVLSPGLGLLVMTWAGSVHGWVPGGLVSSPPVGQDHHLGSEIGHQLIGALRQNKVGNRLEVRPLLLPVLQARHPRDNTVETKRESERSLKLQKYCTSSNAYLSASHDWKTSGVTEVCFCCRETIGSADLTVHPRSSTCLVAMETPTALRDPVNFISNCFFSVSRMLLCVLSWPFSATNSRFWDANTNLDITLDYEQRVFCLPVFPVLLLSSPNSLNRASSDL